MWGRLVTCAAVGYRRPVARIATVGGLPTRRRMPSCPTRLSCKFRGSRLHLQDLPRFPGCSFLLVLFVIPTLDCRTESGACQLSCTGLRYVIPGGLVRRDFRRGGPIPRRADRLQALPASLIEKVVRSEHLQLHPRVTGIAGSPLQPDHGQFQAPAPHSESLQHRPVLRAACIQVAILTRFTQSRLLTTVHTPIIGAIVSEL